MKQAFVFPGQGSQSAGMMSGYADFPVVRETFAEAAGILGQDLWAMAESGSPDELNLTVNTQPLMLVAGVAVYRAWQSLGGPKPLVIAGHSLGEYTALVVSGALSFSEALPLVRYRAESMQQAVPEGEGGMAAILGLHDEVVREVCVAATSAGEGVVEPANFNSPGQVVIAGHKKALSGAMELARSKGAKRVAILPVSVPSHCSLMKPAAEKLRQRLAQVVLSVPDIPVLHNADVQQHQDAASIKDRLVQQLYCPVRWTETVRAMADSGVTRIIECGPGKVLSGLNKRIDDRLQGVLSLSDSEALRHAAGQSS